MSRFMVNLTAINLKEKNRSTPPKNRSTPPIEVMSIPIQRYRGYLKKNYWTSA